MLLSLAWLRFWICVFSTNHKAKARGNAVDKVTIVWSFATDWVREWRDFFCLITETRSKTNVIASSFDMYLRYDQGFYFRISGWFVGRDPGQAYWCKLTNNFKKYNSVGKCHVGSFFRQTRRGNDPRGRWNRYVSDTWRREFRERETG